MLGLAGEELIRKVLALADDFDLAIDAPPEASRRRLGRGRRGHRPQAAGPARERGRHADRRRARHAVRPARARGDRRPCRAPRTPDGEIVDEIQRGYRLRDRVLRPALVAVARRRRALPTPRSINGHFQPTEPTRNRSSNDHMGRSSASTSGRPTASSR